MSKRFDISDCDLQALSEIQRSIEARSVCEDDEVSAIELVAGCGNHCMGTCEAHCSDNCTGGGTRGCIPC